MLLLSANGWRLDARRETKAIVTEGNLPFFELAWERFEALCLELLVAEGHGSCRDWGVAGSEQGCDLVSVAPDGRRWITQCKRTRILGAAEAIKEVRKVLAKPPAPPPDVYQLIACCPLGRGPEEKLVKLVNGAFAIRLVGLIELDSWVRRHDKVRRRFLASRGNRGRTGPCLTATPTFRPRGAPCRAGRSLGRDRDRRLDPGDHRPRGCR